ncbi:MAG TPA: class I SAM-dependent methyltransferase [Vicinamibacterales bacterium]|nr:class I SAM-dependent methyltransferase [Vicinamibacterales bacterium]
MTYGTVRTAMIEAKHIDRRHTQTQEQYAADDLETMQAARRYGAHLFDLFRSFVGRRVLEVGSGIGTMSRPLADAADMVIGIEPNVNCASRAEDAMRGHPRFTLRVCHLEECDRAELVSHRIDTVVCVNVLEHIADDVAALRTFKDILIPGGKSLIFVPAVQAAYGPLDAELGHHRRYSKPTLAKAFTDAGFDIELLRYTNPVGLLGWMYNSHIRKSRTHSLAQVKLFDALVAPWALPIERVLTPPIGLSLVAVGRKT